jgi:hypothetical protein
MLKSIKQGQARLKEAPRVDMPGKDALIETIPDELQKDK